MAQAKEEKGMLRTFWEGFKEGWNGSSATAQETPPPAPAEEVITAADEWDVNELQNAAVAAEAIAAADERDMCAPAMTAAAAPQEKRGLAAFFEGFCEGWENPPASKTIFINEDDTKWEDEELWKHKRPVYSDCDGRIWTDPNSPEVLHYLDFNLK